MARASYGSQVKNRTKQFLAALLDYANDELEVDEASLDILRPHLQTLWQTEKRLVVRTKVRFLESLTRLALNGNSLSAVQIKEILNRLKDFLEILEDNRLTPAGSDTWHFTLKLWHNRRDRAANLQQLETEWESRRSIKSKQVEPNNQTSIDLWQQISRHNLDSQKFDRLTTNPLTYRDGFSFEVNQIYIPQRIVKHQPHSIEALEESDVAESLSVEEFFSLALKTPETKRIAIIGDPGSGKTTLLQNLAYWLSESGEQFPIYISLADLHDKTLERYIQEDWLSAANFKLEESLKEQFHQGRVWLLLDAIDEMAMDGNSALAFIARQLKGWLAFANIVLTCRSNVWDSGKNALYDFEAYCPLSFSYDDLKGRNQVAEFIRRWFKDNPSMGLSLVDKLNQPQSKRIKDAVKNPLRLALLCRIWSSDCQFPLTLNLLYQQFTEAIYEWKQDIFPCNLASRHLLNQALGRLGILALSKPDTRFRLPQRMVMDVLDETKTGFLSLSLELGWLKPVGSSGGEKIYAFFHPTFQEYFAAQVIKDWRDFLPQVNKQISPIFESHWLEVILFWMGNPDIDKSDKEAFIEYLINFPDDCGGFYRFKAYFLAAVTLTEFPGCDRAKEIISQLVEWRFGFFNPTQNKWQSYPQPLAQAARITLLHSDRPTAILVLEEYLRSTKHLLIRWQAAYSLGKTFALANPIAIATLIELINNCYDESLRIKIAESLGKIIPYHQNAVDTLVNIILSTESLSIQRKSAYSLAKIAPGNELAFSTLVNLSKLTYNPNLSQQASLNLASLNNDSPLVKANKSKISSKSLRRQPDSKKAIAALETRLSLTQDHSILLRLAAKLYQLDKGNERAIAVLISLLKSSTSTKLILERCAFQLKKIIQPTHVTQIISELKAYSHKDECYELLWELAQRVSYFQFIQAYSFKLPS